MADKITTLHLKDDLDTNVYPNVKSENIIDKVVSELDDSENVPTSKVVKDQIDSTNSDLNSLKNALTDETNDRKQEDDILKNNIDELGSYTDKRFSTISDQLESNGTAINANKNNIATNKATIDSINTEITEIKEKDSNQDSKISTNETSISELQSEVKDNKDTFDTFVVDQNKTISSIKDELNDLSINFSIKTINAKLVISSDWNTSISIEFASKEELDDLLENKYRFIKIQNGFLILNDFYANSYSLTTIIANEVEGKNYDYAQTALFIFDDDHSYSDLVFIGLRTPLIKYYFNITNPLGLYNVISLVQGTESQDSLFFMSINGNSVISKNMIENKYISTINGKEIFGASKNNIVLSPMIYNHHIFVKGTSAEGFPLALAFDLKNYSSDVMTLDDFMEFASKFPFSCSVQGYYISFNVDVIDFHVNDETMYLRYYQNSDVEEMPISHLLDSALVTFEDNVTGIESWN